MPRLALNKSALSRERNQLRNFERFLPSLDLKRRQLIAERKQAQARLEACRDRIRALNDRVADVMPMLANHQVDLRDLARITALELGHENRLGTALPVLEDIRIEIRPYGLLAKPHWVDPLTQYLSQMLELRVREQIDVRRLALLQEAVRVITQRVNLFDKVLIPRARRNIRRLQVHLADAERAAVVRAKLAKARHEQAAGPDAQGRSA